MARMPVVFFGHGNPMNALGENAWTRAWRDLGREIPRPRAIVCVSAHWYIRATRVGAMARPETIHDFGGFPRELFEVQYPAPGDPALAAAIRDLLAPDAVELDADWGLDHGTWSVLVHAYPAADVPVVQLSIDRTKPGSFHYDLGRRLAALRDDGVLVIGSGDIVHNLHTYAWAPRHGQPVAPFDWGVRFEARVRELIEARDHAPLVAYEALPDAKLAVPTPDHYLPLLYVLGAAGPDDSIAFFAEGFDGGSVSMTGVKLG
jgi:4,5-DOPA dioxygenase extradiol